MPHTNAQRAKLAGEVVLKPTHFQLSWDFAREEFYTTLYFIVVCALFYSVGKRLWQADTAAIKARKIKEISRKGDKNSDVTDEQESKKDSTTTDRNNNTRSRSLAMGQAGSSSPAVTSAAHLGKSDVKMAMALFVRQDLKMGTGKSAAQCAHASVATTEQCMEDRGGDGWGAWLDSWRQGGSNTLVYKAPTEDQLNAVAAEARRLKLPCYLVRDAGRTQIAAGSKTVTCVGPAPEELVAAIASGFENL